MQQSLTTDCQQEDGTFHWLTKWFT